MFGKKKFGLPEFLRILKRKPSPSRDMVQFGFSLLESQGIKITVKEDIKQAIFTAQRAITAIKQVITNDKKRFEGIESRIEMIGAAIKKELEILIESMEVAAQKRVDRLDAIYKKKIGKLQAMIDKETKVTDRKVALINVQLKNRVIVTEKKARNEIKQLRRGMKKEIRIIQNSLIKSEAKEKGLKIILKEFYQIEKFVS